MRTSEQSCSIMDHIEVMLQLKYNRRKVRSTAFEAKKPQQGMRCLGSRVTSAGHAVPGFKGDLSRACGAWFQG